MKNVSNKYRLAQDNFNAIRDPGSLPSLLPALYLQADSPVLQLNTILKYEQKCFEGYFKLPKTFTKDLYKVK